MVLSIAAFKFTQRIILHFARRAKGTNAFAHAFFHFRTRRIQILAWVDIAGVLQCCAHALRERLAQLGRHVHFA